MKNRKKFFLLTLASTAFALSGCNAIFGTADKVKDEAKVSDTKANDAAQDASDLTTFDNDGHFRNERLYTFINNDAKTQVNYTFKNDGTLAMVDVKTNETFNYTYKANKNLIEIKSAQNKIEYLDYAEDIIFHPVNYASSSREGYETFIGGAIGYRDGVGTPIASRSKTTVVGYHFDLQACIADNKSIFSLEKKSTKGLGYPIYANGTINTSLDKAIAIDSSYIQENIIDTTKTGNQVIELIYGKKTYKAILRVGAAAESYTGDPVGSDGFFKSETLFHFLKTADDKKMEYVFAPDGTLTMKDVWTDESTSYSYKVFGNIVEIKDSAENVSYLDYFENVLVHPVYEGSEYKKASLGYLDGYAAALQGTSVIGYHFELNVNVGDTKSVFKTSSSSKGVGYEVKANCTIGTSKKYIGASSFADEIDTSAAGAQIIDITYNNKDYKAVLKVS